MLAVGLQSGSVDAVEPLSGKLLFRLAAKEPIDSQKRKRSEIVALAFAKDSKRLAVVGSKLTLMDIPSHSIVNKLDIGTKIYNEGQVAFNEDGSRLLVTMGNSVCMHQASDLKHLGQFCSPDYHAPEGMRPVCFSPDGKYAIVPKLGKDYQPDQLRLWDTEPVSRLSTSRTSSFSGLTATHVTSMMRRTSDWDFFAIGMHTISCCIPARLKRSPRAAPRRLPKAANGGWRPLFE